MSYQKISATIYLTLLQQFPNFKSARLGAAEALFSLATFPGVVIHEIAHRFFADVLNISVYRVNYFTLNKGNDSGSVELSPTNSVKAALLVALGPLIINTLLCQASYSIWIGLIIRFWSPTVLSVYPIKR